MLKHASSACAFAVLAFLVNGTASAQRPSDSPESFSRALIGTWKSIPEDLPLSSPFEESVWGAGAKSTRTVDLQVDASGRGTLTVMRKIVDRRGRTVAASTSVERASLQLGGSHHAVSTRVEHDVQVVSAVRTYPDDPSYKWDLAGLRVEMATFDDGDGNTIEVRFEPKEGTGAFWQTLHRVGRTPASTGTEQQSRSQPKGGDVSTHRNPTR
jgi:hypothetical protein